MSFGDSNDKRDTFKAPPNPYAENPYASPESAALPEESWAPTHSNEQLNPWLSIWTQPRATIRQILDGGSATPAVAVIALAGVVNGLSGLTDDPETLAVEIGTLVPMAVGAAIGGALVTVLLWYLMGWLTKVAAGWMGGRGNTEGTRTALAWGQSLQIWLAPIVLVEIYILWNAVQKGDISSAAQGMVLGFAFITMAVGIWAVIVSSKCVGEAHLFSAWKGFGASFLAGFLLVVPILVVIFALATVSG